MRARYASVIVQTFEEEHALIVAREVAVELGHDLKVWSVTLGLRDAMLSDALPIPNTEHPAAALEHLARQSLPRGPVLMCDLCCHLKDERILRLLRETIERFHRERQTLILLDHRDDWPDVICAASARMRISYPSQEALEKLVLSTLRELQDTQTRFSVDFPKSELKQLTRNLGGLTRRQARQAIIESVVHDRRFDLSDIAHVLQVKRRMLAGNGLLEFVESPDSLDQIGGLDRLKHWLMQRERAMDTDAEKFGIDAPRGVLMLGVQGAGKSLAAKGVATAWQRPLLRMDVGQLYDRYIGESERRLRDALRQAEAMSPVILWIDEIEKAFASAASQSSDGGLSKRMFGTLLTWMQEHRAPVFTIATANDIEALPPELLRKGRFDEIFFVDLPSTPARRQIVEIHLRRRGRDPSQFDLDRIAQQSDGFSGAEIEQGIVSALHRAFGAKRDLTTDDILAALQSSPPLSVTMAEKVASLRHWASTRCVPAE
jgi:ATP-dependent 26S proteasome regulatory subunit